MTPEDCHRMCLSVTYSSLLTQGLPSWGESVLREGLGVGQGKMVPSGVRGGGLVQLQEWTGKSKGPGYGDSRDSQEPAGFMPRPGNT